MSRRILAGLLVALLLGALAYGLIVRLEQHTSRIHVGYSGEAQRNPLLAAERFLNAMGIPAHSYERPVRRTELPPVDGTLVITTQRNTLSDADAEALRDWLRRGGHLIVVARQDYAAEGGEAVKDELLNALGIHIYVNDLEADDAGELPAMDVDLPQAEDFLRIDFNPYFRLDASSAGVKLVVEDDLGARLVHITLEQGQLTALADLDFLSNDRIGDYDHAAFLWHLVNLAGPPTKVWLVYNDDMPPLWQWLWQQAWTLVVSLALLLGVWLAGSLRRFGPMVPPPQPGRRSLLEHIEASGRFLWQQGQRRRLASGIEDALDERLRTAHPGWASLNREQRAQRLADIGPLSTQEAQALLATPSINSPEHFTRYVRKLVGIRKTL